MMKKILCIALAAVSLNAFGAFGYTTTIINETDGKITVAIVYGGSAGICNPETITIDRGATHTVEPGLCCTKQGIRINGTTGSAQHKPGIRYDAPRTSMDMTCKSFGFRVKNAADGNLIVEALR